MTRARLDIRAFREKHRRLPGRERPALWTFKVDGESVSFWGTLAEARSSASLYAHVQDMEDAVFELSACRPAPRVFTVRSFDS